MYRSEINNSTISWMNYRFPVKLVHIYINYLTSLTAEFKIPERPYSQTLNPSRWWELTSYKVGVSSGRHDASSVLRPSPPTFLVLSPLDTLRLPQLRILYMQRGSLSLGALLGFQLPNTSQGHMAINALRLKRDRGFASARCSAVIKSVISLTLVVSPVVMP